MIQSVWNELPDRYPGVAIDAFVIMPNHVHGIIVLTGDAVGASTSAHPVGATPRGCPDGGLITYDQDGHAQGPAPTDRVALPDVVHRFKSLTTAKFRHGVKHAGWPPFRGWSWQRDYWEHVIRDERALQRIREYIVNNPARWAEDRMHPEAPTNGFVGGPRWRRGGTATCVDRAGTGAFAYRAAMMEG
jgi:putative transposase